MTKEQILKKAIEKAVGNGWTEGEAHRNLLVLYPKQAGKTTLMKHYQRSLIFSHSFAKAFWGEELVTICCNKKRIKYKGTLICEECGDTKYEFDCEIAWQTHLTQMVLEEEPLKYIERFI